MSDLVIEAVEARMYRWDQQQSKVVGSPLHLSVRGLVSSRGLGKTKAMVKRLPTTRIAIATASPNNYIIKMIKDLRPDIDINRVDVVYAYTEADLLEVKRRYRGLVYVDHSVWDRIMLNMMESFHG